MAGVRNRGAATESVVHGLPYSKKGVGAMKVATVIEQALEGHRIKLKDMGATVVWQGRPAEIEVGVCGEEVGQAISEMIDGALQALGAGDERRLVVWARNAHGGVIVGVEYWGGSSKEAQRPPSGAAEQENSRAGDGLSPARSSTGHLFHPTLSEGQEQRALQSLTESRKLVEKCGGRIFVRAFECGSVRFVMELPGQSCELV